MLLLIRIFTYLEKGRLVYPSVEDLTPPVRYEREELVHRIPSGVRKSLIGQVILWYLRQVSRDRRN